MGFNNANRFLHTIELPVWKNRYRIDSPPVEIGNFLIESTQLGSKRAALLLELAALREEGGEEPSEETKAKIDENLELINALNDRLTIPDELETDYFKAILGAAYDEMVANGEPFSVVQLAASTVSVWVIGGREDAEEYWNNGGRPARPRKAPKDHRSKKGTSK